MISERNKYLLSRQLTNEISDAEKEELEQAFAENQELSVFTEAFDIHNRQQISVRNRIDEYRKQQALKKKWLKLSLGGLGIAAIIALIWFFKTSTQKEVIIKGYDAIIFSMSAESNYDSIKVAYMGKSYVTSKHPIYMLNTLRYPKAPMPYPREFVFYPVADSIFESESFFIEGDSLNNPVYVRKVADSIKAWDKKNWDQSIVSIDPNVRDSIIIGGTVNRPLSKNQQKKNNSPKTSPIYSGGQDNYANVSEHAIEEKYRDIASVEFGDLDKDISRAPLPKTNSNTPKNILGLSLDALDKKEYKSVITMLNNLPKDDNFYYNSRYVLGIAYFKDKQYEKAEQALIELNNSPSAAAPDAEWKLLMCYLAQSSKKEKADKFKALKAKMQKDDLDNYNRIDKLLKDKGISF